jgi:hypothetical protein
MYQPVYRGPSIGFLALIFACAATAFAFIRYFVFGTPVVIYKDELVACGEVRRPMDGLFVHSGREKFIRVGGRSYNGVRGLQPFYLRLPKSNSILFVTDAGYEAADFYVVKTNDWTVRKIRAEKLGFGSHIGYPDASGSSFTDFVEMESSQSLVLATRYPRLKKLIYLDLEHLLITKVEDEELDENGRIVSKHVYVNGRQVE